MSELSTPNLWVSFDAAAVTKLSYALRTNPAPLTVSIPNATPHLATLEFVVTNQSAQPIAITSVTFTLPVGATAACITPTTAGILTQVSDPTHWIVTPPPEPVTSGPAQYVLGPAAGSTASLGAGAAVVVQIYQIPTGLSSGTSTIGIKEFIGGAPAFSEVAVTTFPDGFYFNGLIATVDQGSGLAPVAQVEQAATVTLIWNASVADMSAFTIVYSSADGQQRVQPSNVGRWTSPKLTSDTVFTLSVAVTVTGGQPVTAAMSTAVSVHKPVLNATSLTAGTVTSTGNAAVTGTLSAAAITASGATVKGNLAASSAEVTGAASVGSLSTGGTLNVSGSSTLNSLAANGRITASSGATIAGADFTYADGGLVDSTAVRCFSASGNLYLQGGNGNNIVFRSKTAQNNATINDTGDLWVRNTIGINDTSKLAPLVVGTSFSGTFPVQDQYAYFGYQWNSSSSNQFNVFLSSRSGATATIGGVSIYAKGSVFASAFLAFSDQRIKCNFAAAATHSDLSIVDRLTFGDYQYKDVLAHGTTPRRGLMAQQVKALLPQAVTLSSDFIPDILAFASETVLNGDVLTVHMKAPHGLADGEMVRLITLGTAPQELAATVLSERRFSVPNWRGDADRVFVYGKKVNDLHVLNYQEVFCVGMGALQELSKQLTALSAQFMAQQAELKNALEYIGRVDARLQRLDCM